MALSHDEIPGKAGYSLTPSEFAAKKRRVATLVTENYTHDLLPTDDYERMIEAVQVARSMEALEDIVAALPAKILSDDQIQTEGMDKSQLWNDVPEKSQKTVVPHICLLSGRELSGAQLTADRQLSITVLGGSDMDFRETRLPPGETVLTVFCLMGGVDIIVPPNLAVRCDIVPVMGGTSVKRNVKRVPSPGEPYLTINGVCVMGGVDIKAK